MILKNYYNNPIDQKTELYNNKTIHDLKMAMLSFVYGANGEYREKNKYLFDEWAKTKDNFSEFNLTQWSIAEFIGYFDVPREYIELCLQNDNIIPDATIIFNIDMLYSNDQRINRMMEQNIDSLVIDSMYTTSDGIFRDNLIYEKTIEAINSGKDISIYDINKIVEADKKENN